MNLGKFHYAIDLISKEYSTNNVEAVLDNLMALLNNSVTQASEQSSLLFRQGYDEIHDLMSNSSINYIQPTISIIFNDIGANDYVGNGFLKKINKIFKNNGMTPSMASKELAVFIAEFKKFKKDIDNINNSFTNLAIEYDDLGEGEFEIGISIPKDINKENIEVIQKELKSIDFLMKTITEICCNDPSSTKVKTIPD